MPCHYRISLQGISYEVGASRKSLGFRANKKTTFVCKDFEARDSSLNEGSSSFSLKSQLSLLQRFEGVVEISRNTRAPFFFLSLVFDKYIYKPP